MVHMYITQIMPAIVCYLEGKDHSIRPRLTRQLQLVVNVMKSSSSKLDNIK